MRLKGLLLVAPLVAFVGCGQATMTPDSSTGTTSSAPPVTSSANSLQISSPAAGAALLSPFVVSATATACSSEPVSFISYSIDKGAASKVDGTSLEVQTTANAGKHTLHVVASSASGATCQTDVSITVSDTAASSPTAGPSFPADAITVSGIQQLPSWQAQHDSNTGPGASQGIMNKVADPSLTGAALQFQTSFTSSGGERYHATFASDPLATHFLYDGWVYIASPNDSVANIEMDMNQVMTNGQTVIYGFQCDGYSGTWDFTENTGTPQAPNGKWVHAGAACNPRDWAVDTWHHVQVTYSRDDNGNVTYQSVWLDGVEQDLNVTVPSSFALGWSSVLLTNFQVDGRGASGSNTVYLDNLSVTRW